MDFLRWGVEFLNMQSSWCFCEQVIFMILFLSMWYLWCWLQACDFHSVGFEHVMLLVSISSLWCLFVYVILIMLFLAYNLHGLSYGCVIFTVLVVSMQSWWCALWVSILFLRRYSWAWNLYGFGFVCVFHIGTFVSMLSSCGWLWASNLHVVGCEHVIFMWLVVSI